MTSFVDELVIENRSLFSKFFMRFLCQIIKHEKSYLTSVRCIQFASASVLERATLLPRVNFS